MVFTLPFEATATSKHVAQSLSTKVCTGAQLGMISMMKQPAVEQFATRHTRNSKLVNSDVRVQPAD